MIQRIKRTVTKVIEYFSGSPKLVAKAKEQKATDAKVMEYINTNLISMKEPEIEEKPGLLTLGILCGGKKKVIRDETGKVIEVFNDFKMLKECLAANADIADEIVIVTNNTNFIVGNLIGRIADSYNAQVIIKDTKHFDILRNTILDYVTSDWVLMLDIDEDVTGKYKELRNILINADPDIAGFVMSIQSSIRDETGKDKPTEYSSYLRLFRNNPDFYYTGMVHEDALNSLNADPKNIITALTPEIYISHYGYASVKERALKEKRNLELLEEQITTDPTPTALYFRALHYRSIGNIGAAETDLVTAIRLIAGDDRFKNMKALELQIKIILLSVSWENAKLFQSELAKSLSLQRAIDLENEAPIFKLPKYIIGCYYLGAGAYHQAKEKFTQLLYLIENNPNDEFNEVSKDILLIELNNIEMNLQ